MTRPLELDELVAHFTLHPNELEMLGGKTGATRLGFALILKFVVWRARFPRAGLELPDNAIDHVARQVGVSAADFASYDWSGRQIKRHRVEIRQALGFRECSVAAAEKLTGWRRRTSPVPSDDQNGSVKSCWCAVEPNGSSRPSQPASSGSCDRPSIKPRKRCLPELCPG